MRNARHDHHIKKILFHNYFSAMLLVVLGAAAIFSVLQFSSLNQEIRNNIAQANQSVARSVDGQIKQMDTISISALYSNLIKSSFSVYINDLTQGDRTERLNNARTLSDLMFAIIGVNSDIRQINLYNMDSGGFGAGAVNGYLSSNLSSQPWYGATVSAAGKRFISQPYQSEFLSTATRVHADRSYVSLCRIYFDQYNNMDGAIEVVEYYETLYGAAIRSDSMYHPSFYIYDADGRQLYPAATQHDPYYFNLDKTSKTPTFVQNSVTGRMEYVSWVQLPYSGLWSAAVVDGFSFFQPMLQFLILLIVVIIAAIVLCNFVAHRLTQRIAVPLTQMYESLSAIDFENLTQPTQTTSSTGIIEIDELARGIDLFQLKLKDSMDDILMLQRQEAQSQMLAMQSQMNPHFLYNSLSTVRAMAEDGMTEGITDMCSAMTGILQYISSNKESMVPLEQELENTDLYLSCLHFRYLDHLHTEIEVDDSMLDIMVPKLCIQLLVENAIKFTTSTVAPPWDILVSCVQKDDFWIVTVYDNGSGFSDEIRKLLDSKIHKIEETGLLPSLELQGMGLMNIYARLKLTYKTDYVFEYGNRQDGGAFVRIGGKIDVKNQLL